MKTTLEEIKDKIASAKGLEDSRKAELTELVGKLYSELEELARTDRNRAESVSGFAKESANEAANGNNQESLDKTLSGFSSSVDELEASHPRVVELVNRICKMLSDIGI